MRIYTKTGDSGETGMLGGRRVGKDDPRIAAVGTIDELNATLGVARAAHLPSELDSALGRVQRELFHLGAWLSAAPGDSAATTCIGDDHVADLEKEIDRLDERLPPLTAFILPGGSVAGAHVHLARCVCRRAERCVVAAFGADGVGATGVKYLNRLSDLLFVGARAVNQADDVPETEWRP